MYKVGIIQLIVFSSVTMMCTPIANKLMNSYNELVSASSDEGETAGTSLDFASVLASVDEETAEKFTKEAAAPSLILIGIWLFESLACALIADKLYYKKINADLKLIDETVKDSSVRKIMIARRGSVSFLAFIAGNLGKDLILSLFIFSAEKLSSLF